MYEPKDLKRIQDIDSKGHSKSEKVSLANHMASLIKDREKCFRRYEAALEWFGPDHEVTGVFLRKWHILNGAGLMAPKPVAPPKKEVKKVVENAPKVDKAVIWGSSLPTKGLESPDNLKVSKGKTRGIIEIWQTWSMQIVHIYREGQEPLVQISSVSNFIDENENFLFGGKMLDWIDSDHSTEAEKKYGKAEKVLRHC